MCMAVSQKGGQQRGDGGSLNWLASSQRCEGACLRLQSWTQICHARLIHSGQYVRSMAKEQSQSISLDGPTSHPADERSAYQHRPDCPAPQLFPILNCKLQNWFYTQFKRRENTQISNNNITPTSKFIQSQLVLACTHPEAPSRY
jgi:hypothetical protein